MKILMDKVTIDFEKLWDNKSELNNVMTKLKKLGVRLEYHTTEIAGDIKDVEYPNTRLRTVAVLIDADGTRYNSKPAITASKPEGEQETAGLVYNSDILQKLKEKYGVM